MNDTPREFLYGIDYSYIDQTVSNIRASLGITAPPQPLQPGPLLSIHLQSNRPDNFTRFLEELEASLDDPSRIEVVVKIDDTDTAMNELLPQLIVKHRFVVKYISTPLVGGFFELWRSMNDMLKVCHPHAYFLWNMNDEMAVLNKGWDTALAKYVGLFPDHIFRLRTSLFRFRNYYDYWECGFAPETSAITTKRWIEICGDWNPCLGPDSFNQCVAFYFGYHDRFNKSKTLRDVPIHDILLAGEGAFIGLEGDKLWKRMRGSTKAWYRLMSYEMQLEASRRSQKLLAHIWAYENQIGDFYINDSTLRKQIQVLDKEGMQLKDFSYALSPLRIKLANIYRASLYYYYGGGGRDSLHLSRIRHIMAFLALRYDSWEWTYFTKRKLKGKLIDAKIAIYTLGKKAIFTTKTILKTILGRKNIQYHESVYVFDPIQQSIDWAKLEQVYGKFVWPSQFPSKMRLMLSRCLLLQYWYNLSARELEIALGRDLAFRRFVGLPLHIPTPAPAMKLAEEFGRLLHTLGIEKALYHDAILNVPFDALPARPFISNAA